MGDALTGIGGHGEASNDHLEPPEATVTHPTPHSVLFSSVSQTKKSCRTLEPAGGWTDRRTDSWAEWWTLWVSLDQGALLCCDRAGRAD